MVSEESLLREELVDELRNFEESALFLNPSPGMTPRLRGVDIHGLVLPLRRGIGGDHILYLDFNERFDLEKRIYMAGAAGREDVVRALHRNRKRAGVLIADVSGHRMTDALIAAMLHQSFLLGAYYEIELFGEITTRIFEQINERFFRTSGVNKYITMLYGEMANNGKFRYISAAHPPPAIFSHEFNTFMPIGENRRITSLPVGLLPSQEELDTARAPRTGARKKAYEINEIDLLAAGDIIVLHTDGFSDHAKGSFFPVEAEKVLAVHKDKPAEVIATRLKESLLEAGPLEDDVSMVVIKYAP